VSKVIALVAGLTLALLVAASPAAAVWGTTGGTVAGSGYCWDDSDWDATIPRGSGWRIIATPPSISPAETSGIVGGGQRVAFYLTLQRWNSSTRTWVARDYSPLKFQTASWGFVSDEWYDAKTGAQVNGAHEFRFTTFGYYRLRYDYLWYRNGQVSGRDASLAWGLRDDRQSAVSTTGWSYVDWCLY
jgi:hypothetical protein